MEWPAKHNEQIFYEEKQTRVYKYFVPNCLAYLTHYMNFNAHLANGTLVREHSLAFDCNDEKIILVTSSD